MAEVLVLAENVDGDSSYTGTAIPVQAGSPITVYGTHTGTVGFPSNIRLEGSLDGISWVTLPSGVSLGSLSTTLANALTASNHMVNYIRYAHNGASYNVNNDVVVTKVIAIQPDTNPVKITTC